MTGESLKVFLVILSYVQDGTLSAVTPKDISKILCTHPESVRRAVRRLVECGAVAKRYERGKLVGYEIREGQI
jgi:predicted transcriptional regulator